jgi:type I restriction enzyme S subunit
MEVVDYEQPTDYIVENENYQDSYTIPVLTAGKSFILGYTNETNGIYKKHPAILFDDFTCAIQYVDFDFKVKSSAMKILKVKREQNFKYVWYAMNQIKYDIGGLHKRHWISVFSQLEINLPPLETQNSIVAKIEKIENVINNLTEQVNNEYGLFGEFKKSVLNELLRGENIEINEESVL